MDRRGCAGALDEPAANQVKASAAASGQDIRLAEKPDICAFMSTRPRLAARASRQAESNRQAVGIDHCMKRLPKVATEMAQHLLAYNLLVGALVRA